MSKSEPQGPTIPIHCAKRFAEIDEKLAALPRIEAAVDKLAKAVMGNGDPSGSLLARVDTLEAMLTKARSLKRKAAEKIWQVSLLCIAAFVGWLCGPRQP